MMVMQSTLGSPCGRHDWREGARPGKCRARADLEERPAVQRPGDRAELGVLTESRNSLSSVAEEEEWEGRRLGKQVGF